jgi:hypothetical protein
LTDTGITATITPTSATSTIFVLVTYISRTSRINQRLGAKSRLFRDATQILDYVTFINTDMTGVSNSTLRHTGSISYLDSPATTSATTYKLQGAAENTSNSGVVVFQEQSMPSTITLFEIGA